MVKILLQSYKKFQHSLYDQILQVKLMKQKYEIA